MSFLCFGRDREEAGHNGAASRSALHIERTANHPRAVVHQVQPHAFVGGVGPADAAAVILNGQRALLAIGGQSNDNLARVPMLDPVVYRLAGNVIKMSSNSIVMNEHRGKTLEPAVDREQILHLTRPLLQG